MDIKKYLKESKGYKNTIPGYKVEQPKICGNCTYYNKPGSYCENKENSSIEKQTVENSGTCPQFKKYRI
jgi:hypothetical protein